MTALALVVSSSQSAGHENVSHWPAHLAEDGRPSLAEPNDTSHYWQRQDNPGRKTALWRKRKMPLAVQTTKFIKETNLTHFPIQADMFYRQ